MQSPFSPPTGTITETIRGIVDRVTYHNPDNGWSVLRVFPFNSPSQQETVIVHQTKVFAGATMEFQGAWTTHPKFGRQFKATKAIEKKPASAAALEKYLGSGLIKGVGPKTAKKIVSHFGDKALDIFEGEIERLTEIPGIAQKKLETISSAWAEHRAIRDVMMFLQSHGISTLFAVRIYKEYGDNAIPYVTEDPYRLASDFYGIGFFSADKVALSIGLATDSNERIMAAIKHVLAASREFGHCYLSQRWRLSKVTDIDRPKAIFTDYRHAGDHSVGRLVTSSLYDIAYPHQVRYHNAWHHIYSRGCMIDTRLEYASKSSSANEGCVRLHR